MARTKKFESAVYELTRYGEKIFLTGQGGSLIEVELFHRATPNGPVVRITVGAQPQIEVQP